MAPHLALDFYIVQRNMWSEFNNKKNIALKQLDALLSASEKTFGLRSAGMATSGEH